MNRKPSVAQYYSSIRKEIETEIKSQSDNYILSVDSEEYISYLLEKYKLPEIQFDESREGIFEKVRKTWTTRDVFDDLVDVDILHVKLSIPVISDEKISQVLELRGSRGYLDDHTMTYVPGWIITEVQATSSNVEKAYARTREEIEIRNNDIQREDKDLRLHIQNAFQRRRSQVEKEEGLLESITKEISVPLKRKDNILSFVPIPLKHTQRIKVITQPRATPPTQLVLERDKFDAILELY